MIDPIIGVITIFATIALCVLLSGGGFPPFGQDTLRPV